MKLIFFSDAHLKRKSRDRVSLVLHFLDDVCMDADGIYILGDLFEFYHGYENYIYPWYRDVLDKFRVLVGAGKRLYFIEGNHEFNMGKYFRTYTGGEYADSLNMDVEGKKVYIAHGYEIRRDMLHSLVKTRFTQSIMDILGPFLTWRIAEVAGFFFSKKNKVFTGEKRIYFRNFYRRYAMKKLREGYDGIILAHSHIADAMEYEEGGKKRFYLNTGDIINERTYVEYTTKSGFNLRRYDQI
ncbi:MAG: metallophosphoesterase family protein [Syntrophorhabdaceae bacterium]|nr:metallophosphoesterase family protein [Syntrophorhabdaceae bacterium]